MKPKEQEGTANLKILGLILIVIGFGMAIYAVLFATRTVSKISVENGLINTGGGYSQLKETMSFSENVSPAVVKGTATEMNGRPFNFYVFDNQNFEIFQGGQENFNAIKMGKNVLSFNFEFPPPFEGDYYFVASTVEPPIPRTVILTVTTEWQVHEIDWLIFIIALIPIIIGFWLCGVKISIPRSKRPF
jgi:hypothetical protein